MKKVSAALIFCILLFNSCKETNNNEEFSSDDSTYEKTENTKIDSEINENSNATRTSSSEDEDLEETKSDSNNNDKPTTSVKPEPTIAAGKFIKIGEEQDNSCACYCLSVNYSSNSELCLTPSKMYINIRMAKVSNQVSNIFLVSPSSKNLEGKDMPWDKFDKDSPIATLTSKSNGEIEMDWLGFSINGDLAIDYAILGKKTLEGTYKKK
tara:strand:+ start:786 stop:1415 length:630 start_codon:yes stop_codon:yes gene_type:complete